MHVAIVIAIGAGLLSALPLMIAASQPSGLLLLFLAPLPLFLTGLAQGLVGAAIASGTVLLVAGLVAGFLAAVGALMFLVGPCLLLIRQALLNRPAAAGATAGGGTGQPPVEWYPPGLLTTWLLWIGLAWLTLSLAFLFFESGNMQATIEAHLRQALTVTLPGATDADVDAMATRMAGFALGFGIVSYLLILAMNATLAQGTLVRFSRNLRPTPDIADLRLPGWLAPVLAVVLLGAFLLSGDLGFVARNLLPILLLPFFFAGLAVVHAYARRVRSGNFLLALFYVLLVLFTWPAAFVVLLGLFDQWADLRRRLDAATSEREEE